MQFATLIIRGTEFDHTIYNYFQYVTAILVSQGFQWTANAVKNVYKNDYVKF